MEKTRAHIFISGRVQGVFFRAGAQKKAHELGVTGWTDNLADGRVKCVVEGEKEKVEQFAEWCKEGTTFAKVEHCDVQFEDYKGEFSDFEVREVGF